MSYDLAAQGHSKCPKCPSSDGFYRWKSGVGHCFVCGYHENAELTIESVKSSLHGERKKESSLELPSDFEYYIPDEASRWLYKYNLTALEVRRNKIGWSEKQKSIVFPVFGDIGELVLYQCRYFGTEEKVPKWKTCGSIKDVLYLPEEHKDDTIVLVEDIVSAIKVSRVTNCTPLFGSHIPEIVFKRLSKLFRKARVWLDPDAMQKSLKTALSMSERGLPSTVIFSDRDPKEYTTAEIRELVDPQEI